MLRAVRVTRRIYGKRIVMVQNRTMYGMFHNEGRKSPVFKPQYDENGQNLNDDDCWFLRPCPPCSITGKPRRQLGHYPNLFDPIVPYHRIDYKGTYDNRKSPMPWWEEPRDGKGLRSMNIIQFQIFWFVAVMWWLYLTKHFFRDGDELHYQIKQNEMDYINPFYYPIPHYYVRPNNPNKTWIACDGRQQVEQEMSYVKLRTGNYAASFWNMWLEPIRYDKDLIFFFMWKKK